MFAALNLKVFEKFGLKLGRFIELYVHDVKRKKKTWKSMRNNYFFLASCKPSTERRNCLQKQGKQFYIKLAIQTVA